MIRITCLNLSGADSRFHDRLLAAASPSRAARAARFRRREDGLRCLAAEALLRHALNVHHGSWQDISIAETSRGKPFAENLPGFHFSLSHSGPWVVIAWGEREVGLDVERIDPARNVHALARRWMHEEEQAFLAAAEDPAAAFTALWTAREAWGKYRGFGIAHEVPSFSALSPPEGLCLFYPPLDKEHSLCLCTAEDHYALEILSPDALLSL